MDKTIILDNRPARKDLTNRECAKIIGGVLGALVQVSDIKTVREAVMWWAESDEAFEFLEMIDKATQGGE